MSIRRINIPARGITCFLLAMRCWRDKTCFMEMKKWKKWKNVFIYDIDIDGNVFTYLFSGW